MQTSSSTSIFEKYYVRTLIYKLNNNLNDYYGIQSGILMQVPMIPLINAISCIGYKLCYFSIHPSGAQGQA